MLNSLYKILIVLVLTFLVTHLSSQLKSSLFFDNSTGVSSFIESDTDVNNKYDITVSLSANNIPSNKLYIVGNSFLSKIKNSAEFNVNEISDNFEVKGFEGNKIFELSDIKSLDIQIELAFEPGYWTQPLLIYNTDKFDSIKIGRFLKGERSSFYINLTNSFIFIMLLFGILSFVMFGLSKLKIYLFYSLHALMISIYYLNKVPYISDAMYTLIGIDGLHVLNNTVQPLMYYYLTLFILEFIDPDKKDALGVKMIVYYSKVCLVSSALIFILFYINKDISEHYYNLYRLFTIVYSLFISIYLVTRKDISMRLIGYSNIILLILGSLAMYNSLTGIIWAGIAPLDFFTIGMLIFKTGITSALGVKARSNELERLRARESLIKLERQAKNKLEVDLQMIKLREKNSQIEKDISELELMVLRNQLNPHFLYNSMNTLKLYILNNENLDAAKFIDRFAGLFRKVLNNSRQRLINLEDEVKAMDQYLELEQIRFRNSFDYKISIDQSLDPSFIRIPPMIFQPFLENSINHGISHLSDQEGLIELVIEALDHEYYKVIIKDNGVGREYTKKNKTRRLTNHKSLGTQIIEDRLTAINRLYESSAFFEYTDLYDSKGVPSGTMVEVILPINL